MLYLEYCYCMVRRWNLRASWLAQELLATFSNNEIQEVALLPVYDTAGTFIVKINDEVIWDRRSDSTPGTNISS